MGAPVGDYDNDGGPTSSDGLRQGVLYHNNGDGTFSDVTAKAGIAVTGWPRAPSASTTTATAASTSSSPATSRTARRLVKFCWDDALCNMSATIACPSLSSCWRGACVYRNRWGTSVRRCERIHRDCRICHRQSLRGRRHRCEQRRLARPVRGQRHGRPTRSSSNKKAAASMKPACDAGVAYKRRRRPAFGHGRRCGGLRRRRLAGPLRGQYRPAVFRALPQSAQPRLPRGARRRRAAPTRGC